MKSKLAGKKILFACVPTDGHFNPLTGLAKYLKSVGCDVRWYASGIYADQLERLDIPYCPYVKALDINGNNIHERVPELKNAAGLQKGLLYQKHLFAGRALEYFEDMKNIYESFPFDLVICDNLYTPIPLVRYEMRIPVVAVGVIPLAADSIDTAPYGTALPPAENEQMRTQYAGMYQQRLETNKEHITMFTSILDRFKIPYRPASLPDILIRASDLYIQIGTPEFEYDRSDLGSNVRFAGALMPYAAVKTRAPWTDERLKQYQKIVLVTQGTIESDVTKLLEPTLRAFENTEVLVIATTGGNGTDQLRAKFTAENLIITDFIPFDDVMPYASVYITNGGYSGVMLSIKHQLPMVAAGQYELKNEICARLGYFKYGIDLKTEKPAEEAIYLAASEIIANPEYKINVARLSAQFKRYNANELCEKYITELIDTYRYTHMDA